ncbi:villin-3-like [Gossypium australe]|uniref:Villin-3-like n=1 Tax=Gossypium australe TaxID=47621 RepID=A0A5B6V7T9_9ROSI|nr:villin-3-like [Gossypium australe]
MDASGKFEVEEVYNFSQDDLLTEDILILDTHAEVFVWVGQSVDSKEKQNVFEIGQKYIGLAASLDGLSPNVPLYKVSEGNEPCFFTTFFSWDSTRATVQGNSFQKKVALLFGASHAVEAQARSNGNNGGPTQRASALAALSSAFNPSSASKTSAPKPSSSGQGSQRAAAVAALSSVLTAEKKQQSHDGSPIKSTSSTPASEADPSEAEDSQLVAEAKETGVASQTNGDDSEPNQKIPQDENGSGSNQSAYSYEQLKAITGNAATGIDLKRREAYLSDNEFQTVFGMEKEAFYKLPKWKQDLKKKKVGLF